jgi:hypothetical protein
VRQLKNLVNFRTLISFLLKAELVHISPGLTDNSIFFPYGNKQATENAYGIWDWVNLESCSVLSRRTHIAKFIGWNFIFRELSAGTVPRFYHIAHCTTFVSRPKGIISLRVPEKGVK